MPTAPVLLTQIAPLTFVCPISLAAAAALAPVLASLAPPTLTAVRVVPKSRRLQMVNRSRSVKPISALVAKKQVSAAKTCLATQSVTTSNSPPSESADWLIDPVGQLLPPTLAIASAITLCYRLKPSLLRRCRNILVSHPMAEAGSPAF